MALTLFDTNIFIDLLNGVTQAGVELTNYAEPAISVITLMELRAGEALRPSDKIQGDSLLTPPKIKMPDAIIGATAEAWGITLVTRNPKDFAKLTVPVRVPYQLDPATGKAINIAPPAGIPIGVPVAMPSGHTRTRIK